MYRNRLLTALFFSTAFLSIFQFTAIFLYNIYPVDVLFTLSHMLAGLVLALGVGYLGALVGITPRPFWILAFVVLVGIGWELLEYSTGMRFSLADAASDIAADLLGGYVGWRLIQRLSLP